MSLQKRGFSLIELLVVVAIISVLSSLLLATVSRVRDASERTRTLNMTRQCGLALHQYHDISGGFPKAASWQVKARPYLEGVDPDGIVFSGQGMFETEGMSLGNLGAADGTSHTFMIVKPQKHNYGVYFNYTPAIPISISGKFESCFADGSARHLGPKVDESVVRALITWNGGEGDQHLP